MYNVYEGNSPYVFISYAHKDKKRVLPISESLQLLGYRLWYDGGIRAGAEWPENIATHVDLSHTVIAFITSRYIGSLHCMQELSHAKQNSKNIILVLLDSTKVPEYLEGYEGLSVLNCKKEKRTANIVYEIECIGKEYGELKYSHAELEDYARSNGKRLFAARRVSLEKRLDRIKELEEKPELFAKNLRVRAAVNLLATLFAISYAFIGPYSMLTYTQEYSGVMRLIFSFITPPIILYLAGRLLYRILANQGSVEDECTMAFLFAFFLSTIISPFYVFTTARIIFKILISLGLHVAAALAIFIVNIFLPSD